MRHDHHTQVEQNAITVGKDAAQGKEMYRLLKELFPICRSLTGEGVKRTFDLLSQIIPLTFQRFRTGERCYDWIIPEEWNIEDAYVADEDGRKVIDFANNNLHVLGYSFPVSGWFSLAELRPHLHTIPEKPTVIPYRTSYYHRQWGFCLPHNDLLRLKEGRYFVKIHSTLEQGELIVAEAYLPGEKEKEILISSYCCHPSMANDSLSGVVLAATLYQEIANRNRYYSYRFLFGPETIGAIAYLSRFGDAIRKNLCAGFVVTCVGDSGQFNYKRTRRRTHTVDRITENVLKHSGFPYRIREFWPEGSDERQYCSPGFNLPVGSLMRSVYGEFPEYHTSGDNLTFVNERSLGESLEVYMDVLSALEGNRIYMSSNPFCEPQLSKRGLYPVTAGSKERDIEIRRRLWVLNYSDGAHSLIDIADMMDDSILAIIETSKVLVGAGLLVEKPAWSL